MLSIPLTSQQFEAVEDCGKKRHSRHEDVRSDVGVYPAFDRTVEASQLQSHYRRYPTMLHFSVLAPGMLPADVAKRYTTLHGALPGFSQPRLRDCCLGRLSCLSPSQ